MSKHAEVTHNDKRYIELGYNISYCRKHKGYTQEQLAAKLQLHGCDISRGTLAKIEANKRNIRLYELKMLKEVLNVTYDDILG